MVAAILRITSIKKLPNWPARCLVPGHRTTPPPFLISTQRAAIVSPVASALQLRLQAQSLQPPLTAQRCLASFPPYRLSVTPRPASNDLPDTCSLDRCESRSRRAPFVCLSLIFAARHSCSRSIFSTKLDNPTKPASMDNRTIHGSYPLSALDLSQQDFVSWYLAWCQY